MEVSARSLAATSEDMKTIATKRPKTRKILEPIFSYCINIRLFFEEGYDKLSVRLSLFIDGVGSWQAV